MHVPFLPSVMPSTSRDISWSGFADWCLEHGLPIVVIAVTAVLLRWLTHRLIDRTVASLVKPRRKRAPEAPESVAAGDAAVSEATGTSEAAAPAGAAAPSTSAGASTAVTGRRAGSPTTDELPVVRRHARLAARAFEGQFINPERQRQRVETLGSVLRSVATIVIITISVLMIGSELGLNMAPVLASAGVGGVALGFGAQSLVKDFLTGIFMLAEDQYGVGDFIDAGAAAGTVEEVSLRVTRLRDAQGVIWYIRNGEIVRVANKSQGWSTAIVDIPVAYDESPERVIGVLTDAMHRLDQDPEWDDILMEEPKVLGVESVTGGTMAIRILARCAPNEHWGAQREIRERGLTACAQAGIRGPAILPHYPGSPT